MPICRALQVMATNNLEGGYRCRREVRPLSSDPNSEGGSSKFLRNVHNQDNHNMDLPVTNKPYVKHIASDKRAKSILQFY
jgi:hypothetical protein